MILHGHPGGVNWYEQPFWTPMGFCDPGQQADFSTKAILGTDIEKDIFLHKLSFSQRFCTQISAKIAKNGN